MRRILVSLLAVATIAGSLSLATPPAAASDQIVIKQWYHQYGEEGTQDAVQRYADEYHKLNPNVTIQITWVPGDYATKLNAALQTGDAPDVYELPGITVDMVRAGQLATLDDLYTPDIIKDFGSAMGFETIENHIYGMKMITDSGAIYYRKSVLNAAGVKPPTTMDELIAAAKKLTTKTQAGLFIGNDGGKGELFAKLAIWSAGGEILKDGKAAFNTDRSVAAWKKMKELSDTGALLIGAPADWWDPSAFTDGLTAMQWNGLWAMPGIKKALGDDFGVVPWPKLDDKGTPGTWLGGWSEVVNAKSKNLDAAKAFAKWEWIDNTQIQQDWSVGYGFHIPPRASAAASADALKSGPAADVVSFASQYGHIEEPLYWDGTMDTALVDAISNVLSKNADPASELATAEKKVTDELAIVEKGASMSATMAATTATK